MLGLGGLQGMYCGAWAQKYVSARAITFVLFVCVASLGTGYLLKVF